MVLYFAFGSNLWLDQMARRCPGSDYIGRAILTDYKWQINQRGYANVIPYAGSCVHGLVYRINARDEAQLDRNEGVSSGAYEKVYLDVLLYTAPQALRKSTANVQASVESKPAHLSFSFAKNQVPVVKENVLVYLSTVHTTPGPPRPEYIKRINSGIDDSVQLGIPMAYFDNAVRADIPPPPPPESPRASTPAPASAASASVPAVTRNRSTRSTRGPRSSPPVEASRTYEPPVDRPSRVSRSYTAARTAPPPAHQSGSGNSGGNVKAFFFKAIGIREPMIVDGDRPKRQSTLRSNRISRTDRDRDRRASVYEVYDDDRQQ